VLELITGVFIAGIALAAVLEPLLRPSHTVARPALAAEADEDLFEELEESGSPKVRALLALREIEFDKATGKLSDTDYADLKRKYSQAALEAIKGEQAAPAPAAAGGDAASDAEAAIARAKSQRPGACPTCRHALEPGAVFCSHCGRSLVEAEGSPRCWVCGAIRPLDAKFCGECGAGLPEGELQISDC
jgi:predicted nucleic acid-binding Zn ribbon protein